MSNISALDLTKERRMVKMRRIMKGWRKEASRAKEERREKLEMLMLCFGAWKVEHHLAKLG